MNFQDKADLKMKLDKYNINKKLINFYLYHFTEVN